LIKPIKERCGLKALCTGFLKQVKVLNIRRITKAGRIKLITVLRGNLNNLIEKICLPFGRQGL
jgi:hypothetical protein